MKLATSINSYEEIQLDLKIYGKILAESEHIVPFSANRLSKLGKASSSTMREQLALAIKEGVKAEKNENRYEFNITTTHQGVLPAIRVFKYPVSELKSDTEEYRYGVKDLCSVSVYRYDVSSLHDNNGEYRYLVSSLQNTPKEFRFSISSLQDIQNEYKYPISMFISSPTEYRYLVADLVKVLVKEVDKQVFKYDIATLRGMQTESNVYRFAIASLSNMTSEYRFPLADFNDMPSKPQPAKELLTIPARLRPLAQEFRYNIDLFVDSKEDNIQESADKPLVTKDTSSSPVTKSVAEVTQVGKASSTANSKASDITTYSDDSESDDIDDLISSVTGSLAPEGIGVQNPQEVGAISKDVSLNSEHEGNISVKSEEQIKQSNKSENIPTDIIQFVKLNPRCDISSALKYFTMSDINKALNIGRISKSKNKLYL